MLDQLGTRRENPRAVVRHGTSTLFAALDVKSGAVIGECYLRLRI